VPADAARLIQDQLLSAAKTAASKAGLGLAVALALSIYGAMRASGAVIQALGVIYEEEDSRSIFRVYLLSAKITLIAVAAGVMGLFAAVLLGYLQEAAGVLGQAGVLLIQILTWIVAAGIASAAFAYVYRAAPDRWDAKWQWLTIGSIAATVLWLIATVLFGVYVANFADYNATYGSLGAVVVLMMWLWVSAYAILIGAEINAEAERQTGVDSTIGPPRPRGQRGATVADKLPSKRQKKPRRMRAARRGCARHPMRCRSGRRRAPPASRARAPPWRRRRGKRRPSHDRRAGPRVPLALRGSTDTC
jgi:membrane protein